MSVELSLIQRLPCPEFVPVAAAERSTPEPLSLTRTRLEPELPMSPLSAVSEITGEVIAVLAGARATMLPLSPDAKPSVNERSAWDGLLAFARVIVSLE